MYFTKTISTFLVGALAATSALGELTPVPRRTDGGMFAREGAKAVRDMTREEKIQKRADDCLAAIQNQKLRTREDKTIITDDWNFGKDQDTLTTNGLATCYGVVITGSYEGDNSGNDRFMCHGLEGKRDPAESMFDAVEAARENGLGNLYALLVYPDPSSFTEDDGWTDEDRADIQAEHDWYVEWTTDAAGVAPEEKSHNYKESWGMKVNSYKVRIKDYRA
ncbi:hypothetical protein GQX73_g10781 [Xylaria multiplex]|uniref:Ecp2 effector protein domain-containing protein n=1 Tax=Xylaria multiplex TaxID=323545 RepID=A0A7C8IG52_9PEZI|nr:hypothetical protein GQX73_g10781 [Xylaria multiplex]